MSDIEEMLSFAERNKLMDNKFEDVCKLYKKYKTLVETYEDTEASMVNSTIEEHDSVIFN